MGAYTPKAKVWYPGTNDTAKINTLMSTMASSIENGIGARLAQQEIAVGLKASVHAWAIPNGSNFGASAVPYVVNASDMNFNSGFTFANGIATVKTAGMYYVTASLGPQGTATNCGAKIGIYKGGTMFAQSEVPFSGSVWVNAQAGCVVNCAAGDTLSARATITGSPSTTYNSNGVTTYLSIALVQALPL